MERIRIRKTICITVLISLIYLAATSSATVLTFDDVTSNDYAPIPDGYGDLNWDEFYVLDAVDYLIKPSGYFNGLVSGRYVAYNFVSKPALVSDDYFDFIGAYLTAAWNNDLNIDVEGYRDGFLIYNQTVVVGPYSPTWFEFNYTNIDKLRFHSYGGTDAGFGGGGNHFVMDNFSYIPEPATVLLVGLGGIAVLRKLRK